MDRELLAKRLSDIDPAFGRNTTYQIENKMDLLASMFEDNEGHLHITAYNGNLALYDMTNEHLINTINLIVRGIVSRLEKVLSNKKNQSVLHVAMSGETSSKDVLKEIKVCVSGGYALISRYLFEALRRGELIKEASEACMPFIMILNELETYDMDGNDIKTIEEKK